MSKTRKQYDREFKVMAVELSKGRSGLGVLASELETRPTLLYRLAQETGNEGRNQFSGTGQSNLYAQADGNTWVEKRAAGQERNILKKAMASSPGAMV